LLDGHRRRRLACRARRPAADPPVTRSQPSADGGPRPSTSSTRHSNASISSAGKKRHWCCRPSSIKLVTARGGEELNAWRPSLDSTWSACAKRRSAELGDPAGRPATPRRGSWRSPRRLGASNCWPMIPTRSSPHSRRRYARVPPQARSWFGALRPMAAAIAGRLVRHRQNEAFGLGDRTPRFHTYCNALHQLLKRIHGPTSGGAGKPRAVARRDPRGDAPLSDPLPQCAARAGCRASPMTGSTTCRLISRRCARGFLRALDHQGSVRDGRPRPRRPLP